MAKRTRTVVDELTKGEFEKEVLDHLRGVSHEGRFFFLASAGDPGYGPTSLEGSLASARKNLTFRLSELNEAVSSLEKEGWVIVTKSEGERFPRVSFNPDARYRSRV